MKMNTSEAIALAKEGKEEGFSFLYQETYQKSYYVALKFMKQEEEALDVLQDAYIRAFNHMDQLQDVEKFSPWFAKIVASTALNELKKKKAVLFSQLNTYDENSDIEDTFEDDRTDTQPELSYDKKETERLVREMLDSLSDEQRMCILMYYTEQLSVKEIAETLQCSENTVKSRLSYGRKSIKEKVLELEKKGTKLYSVSPIGFFLLLLSKDIKNVEFSAASVTLLKGVEHEVKDAGNLIGRASAKGLTKGIAATGKTIAGLSVKNFVVAAVAVCLVTGTTATAAIVHHNNAVKEAMAVQEQSAKAVASTEFLLATEKVASTEKVAPAVAPAQTATPAATQTPAPAPQPAPAPAAPAFTFTDMSATKYAVKSVNVRDTPNADGNKLGTLAFNEAVTVTGQCNETGWYRIDYNSGSAYVSNDFLADTKTEVVAPAPAKTQAPAKASASTPSNDTSSADNNTPAPAPAPKPKAVNTCSAGHVIGEMHDPAFGTDMNGTTCLRYWFYDDAARTGDLTAGIAASEYVQRNTGNYSEAGETIESRETLGCGCTLIHAYTRYGNNIPPMPNLNQ